MGGGIVTPTSQNPNDPNFNTKFDFAELTWVPQPAPPNHPEITTNLGVNVTEVDSFGLPQQFTIEGTDPATLQPNTALTSGFLSTAMRPDLLNMLESFGLPWSGLIVGKKRGKGSGARAESRHSGRLFSGRLSGQLHQQRIFAICELTTADGVAQCSRKSRDSSQLRETSHYYLQFYRVDRRRGTGLLGRG
jgi:Beta-1,3-glucanase